MKKPKGGEGVCYLAVVSWCNKNKQERKPKKAFLLREKEQNTSTNKNERNTALLYFIQHRSACSNDRATNGLVSTQHTPHTTPSDTPLEDFEVYCHEYVHDSFQDYKYKVFRLRLQSLRPDGLLSTPKIHTTKNLKPKTTTAGHTS